MDHRISRSLDTPAFYYCKTMGDQLCFLPNWDPKRAACDFGRRWGNYNLAKLSGLRWFQPIWRQQLCTRALPTSSAWRRETCDCLSSDAQYVPILAAHVHA